MVRAILGLTRRPQRPVGNASLMLDRPNLPRCTPGRANHRLSKRIGFGRDGERPATVARSGHFRKVRNGSNADPGLRPARSQIYKVAHHKKMATISLVPVSLAYLCDLLHTPPDPVQLRTGRLREYDIEVDFLFGVRRRTWHCLYSSFDRDILHMNPLRGLAAGRNHVMRFQTCCRGNS